MITLVRIFDDWKIKELLVRDTIYLDCYKCQDLYSLPIDIISTAWYEIKENHLSVGLGIIKEFSENYVLFHGGIYKEYRDHTSKIVQDSLDILRQQGFKFITTINNENTRAINLMKTLNFQKVLELDTIWLFKENV